MHYAWTSSDFPTCLQSYYYINCKTSVLSVVNCFYNLLTLYQKLKHTCTIVFRKEYLFLIHPQHLITDKGVIPISVK